MDAACAAVCCTPLLADPAAALCLAGCATARVWRQHVCMLAGIVAGVSVGQFSGGACGLAMDARRLQRSAPVRSAGPDVVCDGCGAPWLVVSS